MFWNKCPFTFQCSNSHLNAISNLLMIQSDFFNYLRLCLLVDIDI